MKLVCSKCNSKTFLLFEGGICQSCREKWEKTAQGKLFIKKMKKISAQVKKERIEAEKRHKKSEKKEAIYRIKCIVKGAKMHLPNDVARCNGNDWEECEKCLRRIAPRHERAVMMQPPSIVAFSCEYLIEKDTWTKRPKK